MKLKDTPIQLKLRRMILVTCGAVLVFTCLSFFTYELITFRQTTRNHLSMVGEIIAANSTAALAFDNSDDANEILTALKAEKQVIAACLYDKNGKLFSQYPAGLPSENFPSEPVPSGYRFVSSYLEGFEPVSQGDDRLGTLYLRSDMTEMYNRLRLYGVIVLLVMAVSFLVAYFLSRRLQKTISEPILNLAATARVISVKKDYSVRARKSGDDELGQLTDAFNQMLDQIEVQNDEITSFNHSLEQKISERTRQLEQSNHDLEQFASVASHDLQEPLRKIQTFSDLAERTLHNEESARLYLSKINSAAKRMAHLISAVLNYSRLSNAGQQFERTDLNEILENVQSDLELTIQEKNAVVKHDMLPAISGVPLQINQLFLNLLTNSLKFCDNKPEINITCKMVTAGDVEKFNTFDPAVEYVELQFADNGIGFDQHHAEKIFNIFQRLHNTKKYPGTGIGLALCKKIVDKHNGHIDVKSEPGKGTTFYIYLPVLNES